MRINRVQRDFPVSNENNFVGYVSNTIPTNFRQLVLKKLHSFNLTCKCINCREIRDKESNPEKAILRIDKYEASDGIEHFISYNSKDMKYLYGFIRLRFNLNKNNGPFNDDYAYIRELHVYGQVEKVNEKFKNDAVQHIGFGKKLLKQAEKLAWDYGYENIAIISAVGTREYYKKNGYSLKNTYMIKKLSNPHIILDLLIIFIFVSICILCSYKY